jgi:hypothetical protein
LPIGWQLSADRFDFGVVAVAAIAHHRLVSGHLFGLFLKPIDSRDVIGDLMDGVGDEEEETLLAIGLFVDEGDRREEVADDSIGGLFGHPGEIDEGGDPFVHKILPVDFLPFFTIGKQGQQIAILRQFLDGEGFVFAQFAIGDARFEEDELEQEIELGEEAFGREILLADFRFELIADFLRTAVMVS